MTHEVPVVYELRPVVRGVAADMARRYGRYGSGVQEMGTVACHWLTQHADRLAQLQADYPSHWTSILRRILTSECRVHGEAVKAYSLGYRTHDVYWYSRGQVESLLPALFDPNAWQEPPVGEDQFRTKSPGPGGGWITLLADLSRAFAQLHPRDKSLLRLHYQADVQNQRVAEAFNVTPSTASNHRIRAIERLVDILGGERPAAQHDSSCGHGYRPADCLVA